MHPTVSALSIVALGCLLGMRHATDADHVVAVATIVSRLQNVRSAAWVGALWGLGHTLTIVAVGVPIVLFNWAIAPRVGLALEFAVGLMLILLGLRNLGGITRWSGGHGHAAARTGSHPPEADASLGRLDRSFGGLGLYQAARPILVGIVHGLAGSAAVALLVLTTIPDPAWAVASLLVFGAGTVAGMALIAAVIALPFAGAAARSASTHRHLRVVTGLLSVCLGLFLAYQVGVVNGLFSVSAGAAQ